MSGAPSPSGLRVKICGLTEPDHVAVACAAGAAYVGFVFVAASPRAVTPERAAALAERAAPGVAKVGLFVDADDAEIDAALAAAPLDMLQLHGDEPPERVAQLRARTGLPVMKALGVGSAEDLAAIERFEGVADMLLCDARPAPGALVPGGGGHAFDWSLLAGRRWSRPWLLAGGLTAATVAAAAQASGAREVDVSSGVEERRGVKSAARIEAFLRAAAEAPAAAV